jgi:uncharacterized protein (TIGR02145 family)
MKTNLLLMMMCAPIILAAQNGNGVTVSGLAVDAGTVTFNVSWNKATMPIAQWSDTVWVFVDYNDAGVMKRLPVTGATASAGTVTKVPNNDKGVWVAGNARSAGSFSATVQLLTTVNSVAGACAYASNYPPVGEYSSDAPILSFTGTPMYEILLAKSGGGSTTVKSGGTFLLPCDYTVTSFTDATGALGQLNGIPFNGSTPPGAASTQIWVIGTQVWSAPLMKAQTGCNPTTNFSTTNPPTAAYYRSVDLYGGGYYYNGKCVNDYATQLCPDPWRVPTMDDFVALDKALGGTGNARNVDKTWITEKYLTMWGGVLSGQPYYSNSWYEDGSHGYYWSVSGSTSALYCLRIYTTSIDPAHSHPTWTGHQVRCVR